jgi:serine/threonine protein kinase
MKSDTLLGGWRLVDRLGKGGNGEVWRCVGSDGAWAAIKVLLQQRDRERLGRFRNEISFLLDHGRRPGVVPIIDRDLSGNGKVWYVMPLAVPIRTALGPEPPPQQAVAAIAAVTRTLTALAEDGIFHRDLKPDNLFRLNQVWSVGDFGLVKYPAGEALTRHGRKLGPIHFMAPEMRESPDTADGELADVYAIAKTLWVLLADSNLPFPAQHRADDDICRLTARLDYRWASQLDLLIERCTSNDPSMRPRMREVAGELDAGSNCGRRSGGRVSPPAAASPPASWPRGGGHRGRASPSGELEAVAARCGASSFSPAVPACHKQRSPAVSSGHSRSLRGGR